MRPANRGGGWWLLVLAIVPIAQVFSDSSMAPVPRPEPKDPAGGDAPAGGKRYPGIGAFGESSPDTRPGPLRWKPGPRLPAEPVFSRALIPNYEWIDLDLAERRVADLFVVPPCDRWAAIERVIKKRGFREIRRHARSDWKKVYETGSPITFYEYEERLEEIHQAGREGDVLFASEVFRSGVLGADDDPPGREVKLVDWGPMGLTESGRIQLDLAETLAMPREGGPGPVEIVPGEERPRREPLFTGRRYKTRTNFRFDIDAGEAIRGRLDRSIDSAGLALEVDFLTALQKKRWMDLEVEVVTKSSGRLGAIFNVSFLLP